MDHRSDLVLAEDPAQTRRVPHIPLVEHRRFTGQLLCTAQGLFGGVDQIIQHHHLFTALQQRQYRM
ncbi:hypothetical protein D3C80_2113100 [compost metagenome]